jgi:hypothetical protein
MTGPASRSKLVSTEDRDEIAMPDDAVFEATGKLANVFRAHQKPWDAASGPAEVGLLARVELRRQPHTC